MLHGNADTGEILLKSYGYETLLFTFILGFDELIILNKLSLLIN